MKKQLKSTPVVIIAGLLAVQIATGGCAVINTPSTDLSKQALGKTDPVSIFYSCELTTMPSDTQTPQGARNYLLSVKYPHAAVKPGHAKVELVIEERNQAVASAQEQSLSNRIGNFLPGVKLADGVQEAWTLEIPQKEAQQCFDELRAAGFFANQPAFGNVHTTVIVESGKQTTGKRWQRVAGFDRLINRVRKEGTLASHLAPPVDIDAMLERAQSTSCNTASVPLMPTAFQEKPIERLPAIF